MKAFLWLGFVGVVTNVAFAQSPRPTMQGNMARGDMVRGDINRPPHPAPVRPPTARPFATPVYPLGFGGYGFGGYDYGYVPQAPSVVFVEPPPSAYAPIPERPPETATMVIHEYQPLSAAATQSPDADQPVFAIVLKDSTMLSAAAVVIQNDGLHIVDPDGGHQRVLIEAIDREATRRVNRERKLQLQLPPPGH